MKNNLVQKVITELIQIEKSRYQIIGEPGYWYKKCQDLIFNQKNLIYINIDFMSGKHNIEKVSEQIYRIFSDEFMTLDITNDTF